MTKKILFVDDETAITGITELLFIRKGYQYIISCSGEEAIEALEKEKSNIGIIFLDLMMPGICGLDVFKYIKENVIDIPTVIQTGLTNTKDLKGVIELGATNFLYKPYSKKDLFLYWLFTTT